MTNYGRVFKENQYIGVTDRVAKYWTEKAKSLVVPIVQSPVPDSYEYRHVNFLETSPSYASLDYTEEGKQASTVHNWTDIDLFAQEVKIRFSRNDMIKFGNSFIADKRDVQLKGWARDVDDSQFHGPKNEQGVQLAEGWIGQLTSIENLNGTNSNLATKGYIWKAIIKMINAIPFALREEGPDMILYMSSSMWSKLISPDRVYLEIQELDMIMKNLLNENARSGFKISEIIVTDKILAEASDDTDGDGADSADTQGTHDRMLLIVPDQSGIGRIISRGFSLMGEDRTINGGVKQNWAWRGRGYIFDTNYAIYTERIVWA
jgi:hypothetical protein